MLNDVLYDKVNRIFEDWKIRRSEVSEIRFIFNVIMRELEDYTWFPTILRKFQMDFIGFVVSRFNFYDVFIQHLINNNETPIPMYDLCSGSGEPAITIFKKSNNFLKRF